ncbi:hypothetical protein QE152_g10873 [Popillia japonica]|uniref:Uncharacterized protein n=1 Tax=Popillia japonica TaxID=7064 RepID=A0AAW1LTV2_POPJA
MMKKRRELKAKLNGMNGNSVNYKHTRKEYREIIWQEGQKKQRHHTIQDKFTETAAKKGYQNDGVLLLDTESQLLATTEDQLERWKEYYTEM